MVAEALLLAGAQPRTGLELPPLGDAHRTERPVGLRVVADAGARVKSLMGLMVRACHCLRISTSLT